MSPTQAVGVAASAGELAIALLCVARATRSPLALPLALLCLDIFGWTGAGVAYDISGDARWHWLDHALTPWTPPLALQFVLVFVGRRRALRATLHVASLACGALSSASLLAFGVPSVRPFIGSTPWSLSLMAVAIPTVGFAILTLVRHLRESADSIEGARTRLLIAAIAIGLVLGATEELGKFVGVPPLGDVGIVLSSALLALLTLRFRLFDHDVSLRAAGYLIAGTAAALGVAMIVFRYMKPDVAIFLLGSGTLTLALLAVSRRWLAEGTSRRARQEQLTTLGRFSAQMAHDMKNPLAALKGAAQLLREDLDRPAAGVDRVQFADLMLDQIGRLEGLVDVYGRLERVEPAREPLDVNDAVREVLALQSLVADAVTIRTDLAPDLPRCRADRAMLSRVIENLVRNALEAMPQGGTLRVETCGYEGNSGGVVLSVHDTGQGMDARTRERAFDDFFTTKPRGSGLGLAFAHRVVHAHGGAVSLESEPGRGTVVRVRLPAGEG